MLKAYKRGDEQSFFLVVPGGTLIWQRKYHFHGVGQTL